MSFNEDRVSELRELIKQMNDAWVNGHPGQLATFFRETS